MSIVKVIVGLLILCYATVMWLGHRAYVRRQIPFQMATGYQMLVVTFTGVAVVAGCHMWIALPATLLYFAMPALILCLRNRAYVDPSYLVDYLILGYSIDFSFARDLKWWGFILAAAIAQIAYMLALRKTFPISERRWE